MSEYEQLSILYMRQANIINIVIGVITFLSVVAFYIDYRNRKNKERAEKSIKIAEQFANSLIPKLSIICSVFKKTKLEDTLNKVKFIEFETFDNDELDKLYQKEEIDFYNNVISGTVSIDDKEVLLSNLIMETLNELEYVCMYISTNVADEKYI